jgi:hypothetical protein
MTFRPGIKMKGPVNECMVEGCTNTALYRNSNSARTKGTQRGYCGKHRSFAVRELPQRSGYLDRRIERRERRLQQMADRGIDTWEDYRGER